MPRRIDSVSGAGDVHDREHQRNSRGETVGLTMPADASFGLAPSKLRRPSPRPGTVRRSDLVDRLENDRRQLVSVVAPAGYGKTTLLSQWADHDVTPFAWVSLDTTDNDAKVLLRSVAEALDRIEPISDRVFDALRSPTSSVPGSVVPRLAEAFATMTSTVVLVLDDVHLLQSSEGRRALSVLAEDVPVGSRLVLAGRDAPPVRIARLRAEDRITEVGPGDLSLTLEEASELLDAAEVTLDPEDLATLHERAEGWPVALYLAALALRQGGSVGSAVVSFSGDDQLVSEYMESELLARIPAKERTFLTRSAALERMSGALCEAALDLPGAATLLADLARSNVLLVPLDRRRQWYRYHHLFGDMLRAELERHEPGLMPAIRRRAASWCLANDHPEEALAYSIAAQDSKTAADLIEQLWLPLYWHGRLETLEGWVRWMDERGAVGAHPMIAAMASFVYTVTGRPVEAERWADLLDQWQYAEPCWAGNRATEAFAATLRAVHCRHGIEQMRSDVAEAAQKYAAEGIVTPTPACFAGLACILAGDRDAAELLFQDAISIAQQTGAREILVLALWESCLLAMQRRDWNDAEGLVDQLRAVPNPGAEGVAIWVAEARIAAHRRDFPAAREALTQSQRLRPLVSYAVPAFAVQVRLESAHAYLEVGDVTGARTVMREARGILQRRPELGTLVMDVDEMASRIEHGGDAGAGGPSGLTTAELRLLPLLCTHLTTPEIAAELYLSRHTVRSQMQSIYRKLSAQSRHQAVARARELNLVG
jgi:LuxR family maltose regulon positive regulatory protein